MDLSIIIVAWQVKEKLKANLAAIFSSSGDFNYEVIVVDNNSQDGSLAMLGQEFPTVKLISNQANLGFAKACNQGMKQAQADFILLLNPDMLVFPDTLYNSWQWAKKNPQAVVSGIKLVDENNQLVPQVRTWPRFLNQLAIVFKIPHLWPKVLDNYLQTDFDYSQVAVVESIRGSYFLINKLAWQKISGQALPLLAEEYFLWFEEVDFCRQVYEKKGLVYYTPVARALDYVGTSFAQVKTLTKQKYFRDSMLIYFKKWQPHYQYYLLKIAWQITLFFLAIKFKKQ